MSSATAMMEKEGFESQEMAIEGRHYAFDLPNGRTVVFMGEETVDAILLIENPHEPKSRRTSEYVETFEWSTPSP